MDQSSSLLLDLLFKRHLFITTVFLLGALVAVEDVACWQHVAVLTVVTAVAALPVEPVKVLLHGVQELFAGDDSVWRFANLDTGVRVKIDGHASVVLQAEVVTVLALLSFLADTGLEVGAKSVLQIDWETGESALDKGICRANQLTRSFLSGLNLHDSLEERGEQSLLGGSLLFLLLLSVLGLFLGALSTLPRKTRIA